MADIEELRRKRMEALMQQQQQQQVQEMIQEQMQEKAIDNQLKVVMMQIMTPDARERINNIRLVNPDLARQVEIFLIQMLQAGKIQGKITDEQLRMLLMKLTPKKREPTIKRA